MILDCHFSIDSGLKYVINISTSFSLFIVKDLQWTNSLSLSFKWQMENYFLNNFVTYTKWVNNEDE